MAGNDVFCTSYVGWKKEGSILLENRLAYSIISPTPAVPGHYIVIPKDHVESPLQLDRDNLRYLWDLIPTAFDQLQWVYEHDIVRIVSFYESLRNNTPAFCKDIGKLAQRMLDHPHLRTMPDGYNMGVNVGSSAGQSVDHFHIHVFPRRKEGKNDGIVTLVREQLDSIDR
jgi:diadenosine tetraphosphate (Ap4A) HIT family hydrolase